MKYLSIIILGLFIGTAAFASAGTPNGVSGPLSADTKSCVTAALTTRESALIVGHTAFSASINTALQTRQSALIAALDGATRADRMTARKNAWKAFSTASKDAHTTLRGVRNSAYATYKTSVATCHADREIGNEKPADVGMRSAVTAL